MKNMLQKCIVFSKMPRIIQREKIQELVKMGFGTREEIISSNFGPQDLEEKKKTLRQKMLRDLTGY